MHEIDLEWTEQFNALIKQRKLDDRRVAEHFGISPPSLQRWKSGKSQPHPSFREFVLRDLREM